MKTYIQKTAKIVLVLHPAMDIELILFPKARCQRIAKTTIAVLDLSYH